MKLIYAGIAGNPVAEDPANFLFNCIRNKSCQKEYFIPVRSMTDVMLYADVPFGTITEIVVSFISACDFNGNNVEDPGTVSCNYGYGTLPDTGSFAVLTGFSNSALQFYAFKVLITVAGVDHVYYSNEFETVVCDPLLLLEACYNPNDDTDFKETMFDCNGVYYGAPTGGTGNTGLRYQHKAFVRKGYVYQESEKLSLTLFNSRLAYKAFKTQQGVIEFETVPDFYKDTILAIYQRGNIFANGVAYTLTEENDFAREKDSGLWALDAKVATLCRQYFGCFSEQCAAVPAMPCPNFTDVEIVKDGVDLTFTFTPYDNELITWQLYSEDGLTLIHSGTVSGSNILFLSLPNDVDCFLFKYKKNCICNDEISGESDFASVYVGHDCPLSDDCDCAPLVTSSLNEFDSEGETNTITIEFEACEVPPGNGYFVFYKPLGDTGAFRVAGPFTTSPIVIVEDTESVSTNYWGYIAADCGDGNFGPRSYFINGAIGCGDDAADTYELLDYHLYTPPYYLNTFTPGLTSMGFSWNCYDRPNKFTVIDVESGTPVATTGWVGVASYAGPWGPSLSTAEFGLLSFVPVVGHLYKMQIETGGAGVDELTDNWDFSISCEGV